MGPARSPLNPVSPQVPFGVVSCRLQWERWHSSRLKRTNTGRECRTGACLEDKWSTPAQKMINLARLHDKYGLKMFWEEKIESHVQRMGNEDSRMNNSALSKLREEWVQRLQFRNQHVIETMREEQIRRAQTLQGILRV
ncbi:unnamed protein product [Leuciscus chuanchicus]